MHLSLPINAGLTDMQNPTWLYGSAGALVLIFAKKALVTQMRRPEYRHPKLT